MNLIKRLWSEESGQGTTEYALILGGIALVAITAILLFGTELEALWLSLTGRLNPLVP